MNFVKDSQASFGFCFLMVLVVICSVPNLTSGEGDAASVVTSQDDDGTCSYILTVPKATCKCDCIKEFQQLTMEYERRLGEVERMLLRVFDSLPQEDDYDSPHTSAFVPNMDSVPVFFPEDDIKPPAPQKLATTPAPSKQPPTEENGGSGEKETVKPTLTPTSKPSSMTVKPSRAEDMDDDERRAQIDLQKTVDVEEVPQQMEGVSGPLVVSGSSEEDTNQNVPTVEVPPPIERILEVQEHSTQGVPVPSELNLPAQQGDGVITAADIEELNRALKTPKKASKARPASPPEEGEDGGEDEEEIPPRRLPPGFAPGMERAAGFTGEVNRPQWKKLEEFLEAAKPNRTSKRERPASIERDPTCLRDGCGCLMSKGKTQSGVYLLPNVPESGKRGILVELYCDLETNGGGWTVIQRRQNGSANFYRNWNHYAHGFGYLDSSFWIGNRLLHALTKRFNYQIRIEFSDWKGKFGFAEYDRFYVGPEESNFQLVLGKFRAGNRGNAFSYHNGTMFSTYDRDNDKSVGECAVLRQAGFWFKKCNKMNPNGRWIPFPDATGLNGAVITWGTWSRHLYTYSMKDFRMMIRPTEPTDFA